MPNKTFSNRWEVIEPLPEGGQGYIYRVKDLTSGETNFILKRLKNKDRKERFEREIEAVKRIDSPYVEKIIDYKITEKEDFYYVMPYTKKTLHNILPDLKGDLLRSLEIFKKICIGIQAAHLKREPIIHRDLKPTNILIDKEDNPKIIDFGLCFLDNPERITQTQEQVGSRFYISPECEMGKSEDIGQHTDIYSLGKILYAMVSGGQIFPREKQYEERFNLKNIISDRRIKYINEIINNCVKEKPSERLNKVDDLISSLDGTIRSLKDGFFPLHYKNELCRFCGRGILQEFGTLRGSIIQTGSVHRDILPYKMILWGCPECGIAYIFKDDIYSKHED